MSYNSAMELLIQNQKDALSNLKGKKEKITKYMLKVTLSILIINILFLIFVPFASGEGETVSFFGLEESIGSYIYEKYDIGGLSLFHTITLVINAGAIIAVLFNHYKKSPEKTVMYNNITIGAVNIILFFVLLTKHMDVSVNMFYGNIIDFFFWYIPILLAFVYICLPIMVIVFTKTCEKLELEIKKMDNEMNRTDD